VNTDRAKTFLVELLNLSDLPHVRLGLSGKDWIAARAKLNTHDLRAQRRFCAKFPEFMPVALPQHPKENVMANIEILHWYKRQLHDAWVQPTAILRQVFLLPPLTRMLKVRYETLNTPPADLSPEKLEGMRYYERYLGNLLMAFLHALNIADCLRFCLNPECPAPHFIATTRRQKYCSQTCAVPAQRAFKLAWWHEHGVEWQRRRRAQANLQRTKSQGKRGK
jgi:hypothetical protein